MGDAFSAIGALADPVRRRLYSYVAAQDDGVGREEAAREVGVPTHTARFHLDKLVEEGLLAVDHRRLSGRTGPGAGRPAKVYRRADTEVAVSLPERGYDLVGRVFAAAVERSLQGAPLEATLAEEARSAGQRDGTAYDGTGDELERSAGVLADRGFEPAATGASLVLRNCPFDALVDTYRPLVCGTNLAMAEGIVSGAGVTDLEPVLDPQPGFCCVAFVPRSA